MWDFYNSPICWLDTEGSKARTAESHETGGTRSLTHSEKKGPDRWEPPYVTSMGEFIYSCYLSRAFSDGSELKNLPLNAGDTEDVSWIPGSGRCPGGGNGNPLKYSCLRNPMDRGAWRATESMGSQKSQT